MTYYENLLERESHVKIRYHKHNQSNRKERYQH